jgi:hypothetical protein
VAKEDGDDNNPEPPEFKEISKEVIEKTVAQIDAKLRYSDESTPPFRSKGRHLFRSKVRHLNGPLSSLSKDDIFQS